MSVCSVCVNETKKLVVCFKCDFSACRGCAKTYILSKSEAAHCMSCKIEWDRTFMTTNFDASFISKEYREHRENVCLNREMSLLQGTQVYVEKAIRIENLKAEYTALKKQIAELSMSALAIETQISVENKSEIDLSQQRKFIRRCPNAECLGFLSTSLKCELCGIIACAECREIKGRNKEETESHMCEASIVESVKAIASDSKACPKCSSLIFKTEGCNQMYCVCCHTAFDWVSLKIETGAVHNPEYFEYRRRMGLNERNPDEILCGRELDHHFHDILIRKLKPYTNYNVQENISNILQKILHIRYVEQPRFRRDYLNDNLDLRVSFMRNQITRENFKRSLQKREKEYEKSKEIYNVLAMFVACITEIFYRLYNSPKELAECVTEMNNLRKYTNECFNRITKVYKCKEYAIDYKYILN